MAPRQPARRSNSAGSDPDSHNRQRSGQRDSENGPGTLRLYSADRIRKLTQSVGVTAIEPRDAVVLQVHAAHSEMSARTVGLLK